MKVKKWLLGLIAFAAMAVLCAVCAGAETYGDFNYSVLDDGAVEITGYNGSAEKVDIPAEIDGKSVTSIGIRAFRWCTSLTSVTIPNSVTNIDVWAFGWCTSLTSITIPDSVTSIGNLAFVNCISLTSITIPNSVTGISENTFLNCTSLTSVTVPDSVTSIGASAFDSCTSLTSITIPNSVMSIGYGVFNDCISLTSITIPDSITSISEAAFCNCTSLSSVTMPDSVASIGNWAFGSCTSLKSVAIPDSVTDIGSSAFENCTNLTSITIPNSVTEISYSAFKGCTNLKSITIPNSVTSIGGSAFVSCTSLTSITIPDSVTSIGDDTFTGCTSLASVTIPDSVKNIGEHAFGYYYNYDTGYKKIDNFKIYCYSGTVGEKYAKDNGFDYELIEIPALSKVTGTKLGGRAADALRINWSKNASGDGYIVEMYQGNKWARVGKITNNSTTTFRKSGLKAGTAYKFRVRAYKMNGSVALYSDYSATVAARTNPSVIKGAKLSGRAADALRINWTKNTSADGYIVEMYQGNKWVRVAKITSNSTTTFRKAGLKASTVYKFRVRAYKMSGSTALYGAYSSTVTARTNPSVMKGVKIAGKAKDALRVNWTKNSSAQGYIVEMYKGGKWVRVAKITNSNTTTFRKAGLAKNTAYKFRVKAYYMSGKTALYGNYGSVSGKTAAK